MSQFVLSIDQGTTSSRALVIDRDGQIVGSAQAPITPTFPQPGWVNQDAEEMWDVTLQVAREALSNSALEPSEIACIGIANQRETTVLWDRSTGRPVAPAIVWQSRQSAEIVDRINERRMGETYQRITGLVPDAYFSATKIAWQLEHQPALRVRAEQGELLFGTVDSWLLWNLSGGRHHVTDASNASRTMLFDIERGEWSDELLADLGIPRAILPEVVDSASELFESEASLFGRPIPVGGVAGDQQAALIGQACTRPGEAKNTYGTGSFLLMNTGAELVRSKSRLLTTIAWSLEGRRTYALEGAIFVTGSAVQWLRDGLGLIQKTEDVESIAASVEDSGGVVFVPALVGLGAPHWDQDARGTITGITRGTTSAHLTRATLDAIAYQTRDVLDAMIADSGINLTELRVDGGAARNDLLMQIQADVLGVPVVRPALTETTALGASYLAELASGISSNIDEIRANWHVDKRFEPSIGEVERNSRYAQWLDAIDRSRSRTD